MYVPFEPDGLSLIMVFSNSLALSFILLAENETSYYVAYVSEQNLVSDDSGEPVGHPEVNELFGQLMNGKYKFSNRLH